MTPILQRSHHLFQKQTQCTANNDTTALFSHLELVWRVRHEKSPDALGQEQRKSPTLRPIEAAAVFWRPTLPTLPDGGLITATAHSPDPWIIPAYVDTMENAKLCISLDLSVTPLFAYSICRAPFTILFKRRHVGAYCTQTRQKFPEKTLCCNLEISFSTSSIRACHASCQKLRQSCRR